MINKFVSILINPKSKNSLEFNDSYLIDNQTGEKFDYVNGVANLLPSITNTKTSKLHSDLNTEFSYLDHYQKDSEIFSYFDKKLDRATKHENRRLHEVIFSKIIKTSEFLLDVGCGDGWLAKLALPKNINVISMDISNINPQKAVERNVSKNHFGLVADALNLPIKNNTLDTIVASEIMEHVADPKLFVLSLYKSLKAKGKLIITTPYNEKLEYNLCVHCNNPTPRHAHLHSFNEKNIAELIPEGAKWKYDTFSNSYITKLRMYFMVAWMPNWLWKYIDRLSNFITNKPQRLLIEITKD